MRQPAGGGSGYHAEQEGFAGLPDHLQLGNLPHKTTDPVEAMGDELRRLKAERQAIADALRQVGVAHGDLTLGIRELAGQRDVSITLRVQANTPSHGDALWDRCAQALVKAGTELHAYQPMTVAEVLGALMPVIRQADATQHRGPSHG